MSQKKVMYEKDGLRRDGAHVSVGTPSPLAENFVSSGQPQGVETQREADDLADAVMALVQDAHPSLYTNLRAALAAYRATRRHWLSLPRRNCKHCGTRCDGPNDDVCGVRADTGECLR